MHNIFLNLLISKRRRSCFFSSFRNRVMAFKVKKRFWSSTKLLWCFRTLGRTFRNFGSIL